jgi:signal transduction histidine kinase
MNEKITFHTLRHLARSITRSLFENNNQNGDSTNDFNFYESRTAWMIRTFYLLYLIFFKDDLNRAKNRSLDQAFSIGYKMGETGVPFQLALRAMNRYRRVYMAGIRELFREYSISCYEKAEEIVDEFIDSYLMGYLSKKDNTIERLHEQKMVIMGQMAASMAHEVRNPLSSIEGFLKLIKEDPVLSLDKRDEYIRIVLQETKQINRIVTQFLQFSRKGHQEQHIFKDESLNQLLHEVQDLVEPRTIDENILFTIHFPIEEIRMHVQKEEVKQVLLNIIQNAFEALANQERRSVEVEAYRCRVNGKDTVEIVVSDNGPGIPEEYMGRVFEPFYSTKTSGTGIGLALCKELITNNNGDIQVLSSSTGTKFFIRLPLVEEGIKVGEEI